MSGDSKTCFKAGQISRKADPSDATLADKPADMKERACNTFLFLHIGFATRLVGRLDEPKSSSDPLPRKASS
jgi:hypothetical protein